MSLQGDNTNILSLNDKVNAFTREGERWVAWEEMVKIDVFTELFFHSEGLSFMAWSKQPTSCIIKYGIWELIFCRGNYSLFSPLKTYVSYWNDDRWSDKESPLNQQSASNRFSFQSRECQWMSWIYVDHLWFLCIGKKYFYIDTYSTAW